MQYEEFQSIMQHLPPSVFFVIMKKAEKRNGEAQSYFYKYS